MARIAAVGMLVALASPTWQASSQTGQGGLGAPPVVSRADPPPGTEALAAQWLKAPILILHGTADSPTDGGVAVTNIQMARDYEAKLRSAGKPVDAVYYEGGRHNDIFVSPTQYRDEVQQMLIFLRRSLGE
jgi:alpha-beta hydrolase superfamily lysophospholipase